MKRIKVEILDFTTTNMPLFLAKLTQRGHRLKTMDDVMDLYNDTKFTDVSKQLMDLPHTTIQRMNYITIVVHGLSTKAVSQLRTHAKRLTFMSTSTQYSSYENGDYENYVMPEFDNVIKTDAAKKAYHTIHKAYTDLLLMGADKDDAGYLLPQSLRKTLVISGNLDDWSYVLSTRLCRRNTVEVQHICNLIYNELYKWSKPIGKVNLLNNMLPTCVGGKCTEGKFSCKRPITKEEILDEKISNCADDN